MGSCPFLCVYKCVCVYVFICVQVYACVKFRYQHQLLSLGNCPSCMHYDFSHCDWGSLCSGAGWPVGHRHPSVSAVPGLESLAHSTTLDSLYMSIGYGPHLHSKHLPMELFLQLLNSTWFKLKF